MSVLIQLIRELLLSFVPYLQKGFKDYVKESSEDVIDKKNIEEVAKDISLAKDRESREKDMSNLINGKS